MALAQRKEYPRKPRPKKETGRAQVVRIIGKCEGANQPPKQVTREGANRVMYCAACPFQIGVSRYGEVPLMIDHVKEGVEVEGNNGEV